MEACPVCGVLTPLQQLEVHVDSHFDDPPAPSGAQRAPVDGSSARCDLCGLLVPLAELDAHERGHARPNNLLSGTTSQRRGGGAAAVTAAAPPSPSTSSDVIIVSGPNSPYSAPRADDATSGGGAAAAAAGNPPPAAGTSFAAPTAPSGRAAAGTTAASSSLPSIICPYGCGQWIPVSELDSHELAHKMAGPAAAAAVLSSGTGGGPGGAAARRNAAASTTAVAPAAMAVDLQESWGEEQDEDWMQAGFDETDYSIGDEPMDDAVAAAVAEEEEARRLQEEQDFEALRAKYGFTNKRPGRCFSCGQEGHWSNECPQRGRAPQTPPPRLSTDPAVLVQLQRPDPQARRWGPLRLVAALKACLEAAAAGAPASAGYRAFLCSPLQHFGATGADRGWGCGWRNIQMLSSALLLRDAALRGVLYGGAGFVPDIGSLQAWLEAAWAAGFDPLGCESLGGRIQGDRKWIGTTEAAALLRFFGVRAQIIDFEGAGGPADSAPGSAVRSQDGVTIHVAVECDLCGTCPIRGVRHRSLSRPNFDLCAACRAGGRPEVVSAAPYEATGTAPQPTAASAAPGGDRQIGAIHRQQQQQQGPGLHQHQPLVDWVWGYFSGLHERTRTMWALAPGPAAPAAPAGAGAGAAAVVGSCSSSGGGGADGRPAPAAQLRSSPVVLTGMPPLYFQHEGHSRTIIGIERRRERGSPTPVTTLLVLDPGAPSDKLEAALTARRQWQRFVRRGLHTLTRPQYQLMYVDVAAGVAGPGEREGLKIIAAAEKFRAPTTTAAGTDTGTGTSTAAAAAPAGSHAP